MASGLSGACHLLCATHQTRKAMAALSGAALEMPCGAGGAVSPGSRPASGARRERVRSKKDVSPPKDNVSKPHNQDQLARSRSRELVPQTRGVSPPAPHASDGRHVDKPASNRAKAASKPAGQAPVAHVSLPVELPPPPPPPISSVSIAPFGGITPEPKLSPSAEACGIIAPFASMPVSVPSQQGREGAPAGKVPQHQGPGRRNRHDSAGSRSQRTTSSSSKQGAIISAALQQPAVSLPGKIHSPDCCLQTIQISC